MEITNDKYELKVGFESDPQNPRTEWDNLGTMVCFHRNYSLGDKTDLKSDDFDGWEELESYLKKEEGALMVIPLYMYDHSGITINTTGFSCRWDSGQIGFIYISKEKVRKEYNCKRISEKLKEKVRGYLLNEVKIYDEYVTGNVYWYEVLDKESGDMLDSCGGFYGSDFIHNGLFDNVSNYFTETEIGNL